MKKIPVVLCIDVEPDEREIDITAPKEWEGFKKTSGFFIALRSRLEEATQAPVSFSWFVRMDPQIEHAYGQSWWVAKRYGDVIAQLEAAGDEIGLHTHAWRWRQDWHRWIIDHGDQQWVNHCVNMSFEAYQTVFGRSCISFRFGDRWMSDATMDLLEKVGVQFDLTIEPGVKATIEELHTGSFPDYTDSPRYPYRPSQKNLTKDDPMQARGLWIIPLSTGTRSDCFTAIKHVALTLGVGLQSPDENLHLNLALQPRWFRKFVNKLIAADNCYLAPVVRTDVGVNRVAMNHMERNVKFILSHPLLKHFTFVRPAKAVELLTRAASITDPIHRPADLLRTGSGAYVKAPGSGA